MNDPIKDPPLPVLLPTSSAMVPTSPRSRLAELDRAHLAGLVEDIDNELQDEGPILLSMGISGAIVMITGGLSAMLGITTGFVCVVSGGILVATSARTLVKARLLRRSLSTTLVDEDVRRLFRATKRARNTFTRRALRESAELELGPRAELLLAAVEADLGATTVSKP